MKRIFTVLLIALLLHTFSPYFVAFAEQNNYCDPIPQDLITMIEGVPQDCIVFDAPDGTVHAYIIEEYGSSLDGYRLTEGQWEMIVGGGDVLNYRDDARFVRHQANQLRPDGTAYGDAQGFDIVASGGVYDSYHWNGEYYTLCGWCDPERYNGIVMIQGTTLKYFPQGSMVPEYETNTDDELTMYSWTGFYQDRPATPEEARKRAAILPKSVQEMFPGKTLVEYRSYNSGTEAEGVFASITNEEWDKGYTLHTVTMHFIAGQEEVYGIHQADIPLSDQLKDIDVQTLWENAHELLTQPGAIDSNRIPVKGRVVDYAAQEDQLILLTEDDAGKRRILIAYQDAAGVYTTKETNVLPPDTRLDTFHAGENEIELEFNNQEWGVGYHKTSPDWEWRLNWVMGEDTDRTDYTVYWWGVSYSSSGTDGDYQQGQLIGSLENSNLMVTDFVSIPRTLAELKQTLNQNNWAVVCNPNPEDRLYLRPEAGNRDTSLGKFYNGTPVKVLETESEWCHVKIGLDGPEGWMMKKYLVFGDQMNSVEIAFPVKELKEEYQNETAWSDPEKTNHHGVLKDHTWHIMGVYKDLYILFDDNGNCAYAPVDWFWEGNG